MGDARLDYNDDRLRLLRPLPQGREDARGSTRLPKVTYYTMGLNKWQTVGHVAAGGRAADDVLSCRAAARRTRSTATARSRRRRPTPTRPDAFTYDPMNPVLSYGGNVCCTGTAVQAGAFDQRRMEARDDILVYTTEPFKEGTEVSGPITPTLYVSSDAKDTDFTVKVLDVYPDGRAYNLDESIQRMRYRDGYDKPLVWMESGKVYKVDAAAAEHEQLLRRRAPAAHRGLEQQLPALRSQPEHRRQQLRRDEGRRRAQRRAPLEAVSRRRSRSRS